MQKIYSMNRIVLGILTAIMITFTNQVQVAAAEQTAAVSVKAKETLTTYSGREGVRELLNAIQSKEVPPGKVVVDATATDTFNGSLDSLEDTDMYEGPAKALMMALESGRKMPADLHKAATETIVTTYNSWVVVASGVSCQRIPEWTASVMTRVAAGNEVEANEATKLQIDSEQRVDRLADPSWLDSFAWWWSR